MSSGDGTSAIWTFVAPMIAIFLVGHDSRGNCTFNHIIIIVLPQEKSLSVSLDQQCGPDTGPS